MGENTEFEIIEFNPWSVTVRAPSQADRAWNNGDWSGAEWNNAVTIPFNVCIEGRLENGCGGDFDTWIENRHQLALAFSAVEDAIQDVELRFLFGSREYVIFGRPRMVDPDSAWLQWVRAGGTSAACAFVALDPLKYSGELQIAGPTGLPVIIGGLCVPFCLPACINSELISGQLELVNIGTANTGLFVRIDAGADGVVRPGFLLRRADGTVQSVSVNITLNPGEWLEIDTVKGTVLINGLPEANQRGVTDWNIDPYPLQPGVNLLRFTSGEPSDTATITVTYRHAWK